MTPEELAEGLKKLNDEHVRSRNHLLAEYARAHNDVNVGDIIEDHLKRIRVDRITFSAVLYPGALPCCEYHGPRFTTANKPFKNGETCCVQQRSIKKNHTKGD